MLGFFLDDEDENDGSYDAQWIEAHQSREARQETNREWRKPHDPDAAENMQLRRQVEKLRLVSRALCELLIEQTNLTEDAVLNRIDEIDLRDGNLDGRMRGAPMKCPACQRTVGLNRTRCQYCGANADRRSSLDGKSEPLGACWSTAFRLLPRNEQRGRTAGARTQAEACTPTILRTAHRGRRARRS